MSAKNKKQFGVWMDHDHATVVGNTNNDAGNFEVLGHVKGEYSGANSNEHTGQNAENTEMTKFFKSIAHLMQNAEEVHVTGPGVMQERFIKYLGETAQFKNVKTSECTSNKMSDEGLIEHIGKAFHK